MATEPVIRILSEPVARKIAAGEVIERPQSVARELLDNSLDAGATSIDVRLEAGGNDLIRVTDNGRGMTREDLVLCYLPHATSKIRTENDLLRVNTLGFRGEALSSMAAVSRLTVTSQPNDETGAAYGALPHRVEVHAGKLVNSGPAAGSPGTTVDVSSLFYNMPARKQFLKRPQSESSLVRRVLLDKALAFPEVEFRLFSGPDLRLYLPKGSPVERITAAYPERTEPALFSVVTGSGEGFSFQAIAAEPSAARKDRKQIQIFVNRRRIWEFSLVQAIEYAYRDYLYGGLFPVAYLFLEVAPHLVDFNIHPAKREARFRNMQDIHRTVVDALRSHLRLFDRRAMDGLPTTPDLPDFGAGTRALSGGGAWGGGRAGEPRWTTDDTRMPHTGSSNHGADRPRSPAAVYDLTRSLELPPGPEEEHNYPFRYLGQVFGLFLVVERDDTLFLVDQHAAHERIIYDRLRCSSASQDLLIPVSFGVDNGEDSVLSEHIEDLDRIGVHVRRAESGEWELTGIPAAVHLETDDLVEMIRELAGKPEDFERELYAAASCRAAVKDGDVITRKTALDIICETFEMVNARCPHGRRIWTEFSREQLMALVDRI